MFCFNAGKLLVFLYFSLVTRFAIKIITPIITLKSFLKSNHFRMKTLFDIKQNKEFIKLIRDSIS